MFGVGLPSKFSDDPTPIVAMSADPSGRLLATYRSQRVEVYSGGAQPVLLGEWETTAFRAGHGAATAVDGDTSVELLWSSDARWLAVWHPVYSTVRVYAVGEVMEDPIGSEVDTPSWITTAPVSSEPALRRVRGAAISLPAFPFQDAHAVCRYGSLGLLIHTSEPILTLASWNGALLRRYALESMLGPHDSRLSMGWVRHMLACRSLKLCFLLFSSGDVVMLPIVAARSSESGGGGGGASGAADSKSSSARRRSSASSSTPSIVLSSALGRGTAPKRRAVQFDLSASTSSSTTSTTPAIATSIAFAFKTGTLAIGMWNGDVQLFHFDLKMSVPGVVSRRDSSGSAKRPFVVLRQRPTLSLFPWGFKEAHTGHAHVMRWGWDGSYLAVGHSRAGVSVWSASGTRLFTTLPTEGPDALAAVKCRGVASMEWLSAGFTLAVVESNPESAAPLRPSSPRLRSPTLSGSPSRSPLSTSPGSPPGPASGTPPLRSITPMSPTAAVASVPPENIRMAAATSSIRGVATLLRYDFRVCTSTIQSPSSGTAATWFMGPDRLFMLRPSSGTNALLPSGTAHTSLVVDPTTNMDVIDVGWHPVPVHRSYIASNSPLRVVASCDSRKVLVAGWRGFAVYDCRTEKWKLFADVRQEIEFHVLDATWWRNQFVIALTQCVPPPSTVPDSPTGSSLKSPSGGGAGGSGSSVTGAPDTALHFELRLYPATHLSREHLVCRVRIPPDVIPSKLCITTIAGPGDGGAGHRPGVSGVVDTPSRVTWLVVLGDTEATDPPMTGPSNKKLDARLSRSGTGSGSGSGAGAGSGSGSGTGSGRPASPTSTTSSSSARRHTSFGPTRYVSVSAPDPSRPGFVTDDDSVLWRTAARNSTATVLLLYRIKVDISPSHTGAVPDSVSVAIPLHSRHVLPSPVHRVQSVSVLPPRRHEGTPVDETLPPYPGAPRLHDAQYLPLVVLHTASQDVVEVNLRASSLRVVETNITSVFSARESAFGGSSAVPALYLRRGPHVKTWLPSVEPDGPSAWASDSVLVLDNETELMGIDPVLGVAIAASERQHWLSIRGRMACHREASMELRTCLHQLLRVYLGHNLVEQATELADAARAHPTSSFSRVLEHLLFGALEDAHAAAKSAPPDSPPFPFLVRVVELVKRYPECLAVIATVGRKTEPSRSKLLFPLAGEPLQLYHQAVKAGKLDVASGILLLIMDEALMEDPDDAGDGGGGPKPLTRTQRHALSLVRDCAEEVQGAAVTSNQHMLADQAQRFAGRVTLILNAEDAADAAKLSRETVAATPEPPTTPTSTATVVHDDRLSSAVSVGLTPSSTTPARDVRHRHARRDEEEDGGGEDEDGAGGRGQGRGRGRVHGSPSSSGGRTGGADPSPRPSGATSRPAGLAFTKSLPYRLESGQTRVSLKQFTEAYSSPKSARPPLPPSHRQSPRRATSNPSTPRGDATTPPIQPGQLFSEGTLLSLMSQTSPVPDGGVDGLSSPTSPKSVSSFASSTGPPALHMSSPRAGGMMTGVDSPQSVSGRTRTRRVPGGLRLVRQSSSGNESGGGM